ncbi:Bax inhibitor-1/YccA family membrane protein [Candidatus Phytoplasma prunorum]|uniref:Bax inhibitor-1/YccA family membrane protein n=1 Tax=Candidatus Phytoplasma prunorum TaxID=47565 RepID=UPI002FF05FB2
MNKNIILNDVVNGCVNKKSIISTYKNNVSRKSIALKTIMLLVVTILSTMITFFLFNGARFVPNQLKIQENTNIITLILYILPIISFLLIMSSRFLPVQTTKFIATTYSILEGIFFGTLFCFLNVVYSNVFMLISIDFLSVLCLFIIMNLAFYNNIIKVNKKFVTFIVTSMILIFILDLIILFTGILGNGVSPLFGALVSIIAIIISTLSLAMDFQYADYIVEQNISKDYEWKVALGFQITLIYIFIRILQLMMYLGVFKKRE